ncbi:MAG: tRNA (guanosine(37)-N1)-methyltransferase TrmD [Burkholderiaceae bacterium]|jgi:tRNA (guanine37-N1)-methyltransferase
MRFDVITLFPDLIRPWLTQGVTRRAFAADGPMPIHVWNLRDFAQGNYRRVDDRPFGGGPGMVLQAEPLAAAVQAAQQARRHAALPVAPVVCFSPVGQRLNQAVVDHWAAGVGAVLVCGRYEGIDQRFIDQMVDAQISLGDFVLSGGELAALALLDAVARGVPGVLGGADSARQDSFHSSQDGLLDCPHYTRPEVWHGPKGAQGVPEVLLGGDHQAIARFRREQRLAVTQRWRPDLLEPPSPALPSAAPRPQDND